MTRDDFRGWVQNRLIYLDGATGSNLMDKGMPSGVCPEEWILQHKDIFLELQKGYVEAGSNVIYAPTFTANRIKLEEYGLAGRMQEMITELVALSKQAIKEAKRISGDQTLIAGDLTMTGRQLAPIGDMELEDLIDVYKEQVRCLACAGVDLLIVETMMSLQEARAALIAAKEVCNLPVMVSMTFEPDGRTLYGSDAVCSALTLEALGADAIGANCSTGPDRMVQLIKSMAEVVSIPIIAKPNAGLPIVDENGRAFYDMDATTFTNGMKELVNAGATIIGGCCGTTPQYIRELKETLGVNAPKIASRSSKVKGYRYLTSENQCTTILLEAPFTVVGERINPTGKKKLQEELKIGSLDLVQTFAQEQEKCGARVLDVNMGMSGIDEKEMLIRAMDAIRTESNLPLSLDSSHIDVLEAALRKYPGRALVNSVSMETEKIERLLPIVKKYGAMFILLPLSDKGLPANEEEKRKIIETVYERALLLGMKKEDIVVDALINTVGANPEAARLALDTIRYCKENGFATICGLSNISFGLPQRSFVNAAFLTMALQAGLTMAIANPSQELLMLAAYASELLLNKEDAAIRYITYADSVKGHIEVSNKTAVTVGNVTDSTLDDTSNKALIKKYVLKGNKDKITEVTIKALEEGHTATELLQEVLIPAINEVGALFEKGKYFLPQLIGSAEAMKTAIEYLQPLLLEAAGDNNQMLPVVVIATVKGDIHDIGKNLVALMLKNYGFQVYDLGKDVAKEEIIEAAKEYKADIIALSALMTTTMREMKEIVSLVKEEQLSVKVMIGGAVITQDYADEIGADGYSKDAAEAVKVAKQLLNINN